MFIYVQKVFAAASAGERMVGVQCDKCGCEYYYLLKRFAAGGGVAPYGLGQEAAANSAQENARRELQRQLEEHCELVPCPRCHWINDELVRGYRLSQYGDLAGCGLVVAVLGTVACLVTAYYLAITPPKVSFLPYLWVGGPTFFLSFGGAMLLLRNWLRSGIRPNSEYPDPPRPPSGTPPALILDRATGQFRPAIPPTAESAVSAAARIAESADRVENAVEFQYGRDQFPPFCAACLGETDACTSYALKVDGAVSIEVPLCASCNRNSGSARFHRWCIGIVVLTLVGVVMLFHFQIDSNTITKIVIPGIFVAWCLGAIITSEAAVPVKLLNSDTVRGIFVLRFANSEYGALVAKHNRQSVTKSELNDAIQADRARQNAR